MYICENCGKEHNGSYGSGRFCSTKCSRGFSTKGKRSLINSLVSETLKRKTKVDRIIIKYNYVCEKCECEFESIKIRSGKKIHCNNCKRIVVHAKSKEEINTILDLAKTTVVKILYRAKRKCERCGWNESTLDIHHINGKKIENCNNLSNLVILCPNCHRLVHTHKIKKEELYQLSMDNTFSDWIQYYHPSN